MRPSVTRAAMIFPLPKADGRLYQHCQWVVFWSTGNCVSCCPHFIGLGSLIERLGPGKTIAGAETVAHYGLEELQPAR